MTHEAPRSNEEVLAADECPVPNCIEPTGHGHTAPQPPDAEATAGPWELGGDSGDEGTKILGPPGSSGDGQHPEEREWIATVYDTTVRGPGPNATLIVQAPTLIAELRARLATAEAREQALREALKQRRMNCSIESHGGADPYPGECKACDTDNAALAKTGEPQSPTRRQRLRDTLGEHSAAVRFVPSANGWLADVFHENGVEVGKALPTIEQALAFLQEELGDDD